MAEIDPALLDALANRMDDYSHRAQDVLSRYLDHTHQMQAHFTGQGGTANLVTAGEIHDAQARIQAKYRMVTEVLRGNTQSYVAQDQDAAQGISAVAGGLKFS
jgi:WXG100 family type VII secretion target